MMIEFSGDQITFLFCFTGKGVRKIGSHNTATVTKKIIGNIIK